MQGRDHASRSGRNPVAGFGAGRGRRVVNLPPGVRISRAPLDNEGPGMLFEIERSGHRIAFNLPEADALAIALTILGVSIEIRDTVASRWRPRLIEGGQQ